MKKYARWIVMGGVLVALVASYGWASSPGAEPMTPRASEAWSRGQIVGQTLVKRPPSLRPAPGGGIYLVWPNLDGRLELARVGGDGEILLDRVLPVGTRKARDPQLTVGRDGRLHLLWREHGGSRVGVQYALLEPDGTPVGQPQILSDPDDWVLGVPRLIQGAEGRLNALWADDAGIDTAGLASAV